MEPNLDHVRIQGASLHNREALEAAHARLEKVRDRLVEKHLGPYPTSVGDAGTGLDEVESRLEETLRHMGDPS